VFSNLFFIFSEKEITFCCDLDANKGRSFRIDVVIVYDVELNNQLKTISVSEYFEKKDLLRRENPYSIKVYEYEVVPGQAKDPKSIDLDKEKQVINIIICCEYPNDNRTIPRKIICGSSMNKIRVQIRKDGAFLLE